MSENKITDHDIAFLRFVVASKDLHGDEFIKALKVWQEENKEVEGE